MDKKLYNIEYFNLMSDETAGRIVKSIAKNDTSMLSAEECAVASAITKKAVENDDSAENVVKKHDVTFKPKKTGVNVTTSNKSAKNKKPRKNHNVTFNGKKQGENVTLSNPIEQTFAVSKETANQKVVEPVLTDESANLLSTTVYIDNNKTDIDRLQVYKPKNNIDNVLRENGTKRNFSLKDDVKKVLEYFNQKCGTRYRGGNKTINAFIGARFKDGFSFDDMKTVIDHKHDTWGKDVNMAKYVRPDTLFRPSHFEIYLQQALVDRKKQKADFEYVLKTTESDDSNPFD